MEDIRIEIDGLVSEKVIINVKKDLHIGKDLEYEARSIPGLYGYYSVLAHKAEERCDRVSRQFDTWKSGEEDFIFKKIMDENKCKKKDVRVKEVQNELLKDAVYRRYLKTLERYRYEVGVLKSIAKSFELKKDLVQTMCANRRRET